MVELCGARVAPGTIDVGGAAPAGASHRAARGARRGILGVRSRASASARSSRALDFAATGGRTGST